MNDSRDLLITYWLSRTFDEEQRSYPSKMRYLARGLETDSTPS
jgi:hypothetical protein